MGTVLLIPLIVSLWLYWAMKVTPSLWLILQHWPLDENSITPPLFGLTQLV